MTSMKRVEITKPVLKYNSEEALKSLRTNLLFCGSDKKAIVFTSCTQNEGKTRTALNLGLALTEIGKKVLLMDADLRKSMLIGRIKVKEEIKGLSHFLSKQETLANVLYSTNVPNFHVVFSGPVPPNPTELLSDKYFGAMLETMRSHYDYILIDSPPLGSVIDSAIIAEKCDGAILVIESGWNSWRFEQEIKSQLEKTGCPILGAILNKVDVSSGSYYGKYGRYGKYGKYGSYGVYGKSENTDLIKE